MATSTVEGTKTCGACREEKNLDDFHRNYYAADKRQWRCKECVSQHFRDNPETLWSSNYRRRALRLGVPVKDFGVSRQELIVRDGPGCAECGVEDVPLQLDHKVPLRAHGSHSVWNCWLLCGPCHRVKTIEDNARRREFESGEE